MSLSRLLSSVVRENPDIQVILLTGNGNGAGGHEDYDDRAISAPPMTAPPPPWDASGDAAELQQLRGQVQSLTAELQAAQMQGQQAPQVPAGGEQPTGLGGSLEDHSIDVLGFEDEKLENKLVRLGYDTVGKVRAALLDGMLAEAKLKKDWLVDVGMRLAGAAPSGGSAGSVPVPASVGGVSDVPAGHADRPWLERLAVAKQKQAVLDELHTSLAVKQEEVTALNKRKADIPEELDEDIINLEESIGLTKAHLVALRYSMNLDPSPDKSLDEALSDANLGPWMGAPQPRVMD